MDKEQEEAVLRVTAQYVAEVHAGRQPRLSDYLARYPQYGDAITEFVTYFHAIEVNIPEETVVAADAEASLLPSLSESSRLALARAWEGISQPEITPGSTITTLQMTVNNSRFTFSQLAASIGLSRDIVEKLERRTIDASTIPQEVVQRLAEVLQQPLNAILTYFSQPVPQRASLVAESLAAYEIKSPGGQRQSFREAIEQSTELSKEQKTIWRSILSGEGL